MTVETSFFIITALCLIQISKLNYVLNCDRTELNKLVKINNFESEDVFSRLLTCAQQKLESFYK
jgi:hypothetical protein